ncbi:MAG TPA: hypothetical protein VIJ93_13345, partial [bacterium]
PGKYWVETHWDNGKGGNGTITKDITVTGGGSLGTAWAQPNLITANATGTTFKVDSPLGLRVTARIYTLAGERVIVVNGEKGTNEAFWDAKGMASGTYLADVEWIGDDGRWLGRKILKVMVIR